MLCCTVGTQQPACGADTPVHLSNLSAARLGALPTHRSLRKPQAIRNHSHSVKPRERCRLCHTRCQASKPSSDAPPSIDVSPEVGKGKTLLIIGGTGRVGSSTAASLVKTHPNLTIILGTRSQEGYDAAVKNRPELGGLEHRVLDRNKLQSILSSMEGCDMVLHTAGPFQRKKECLVLEAAIQAKIPYLGRLHSICTAPGRDHLDALMQSVPRANTRRLLYCLLQDSTFMHLPIVPCTAPGFRVAGLVASWIPAGLAFAWGHIQAYISCTMCALSFTAVRCEVCLAVCIADQ